jgi:hypothetical protein
MTMALAVKEEDEEEKAKKGRKKDVFLRSRVVV